MLQTAIETATLAAILVSIAINLYALWRMIALTAEAREARRFAVAATRRSEDASMLAASNAADATVAITAVAANVQKIELATNSMKDQLVKSTAKASHLEGRAELMAEQEAKNDVDDIGKPPPR